MKPCTLPKVNAIVSDDGTIDDENLTPGHAEGYPGLHKYNGRFFPEALAERIIVHIARCKSDDCDCDEARAILEEMTK